MCACVLFCMCLCTINGPRSELSLHVHSYIHTYNTYIYIYIHTYIYTYIHIYIHTYIHIYIHTYIDIYIYTYIPSLWPFASRALVHTYIHTYIHTCILHKYIHLQPYTQETVDDLCFEHQGRKDPIGTVGHMSPEMMHYEQDTVGFPTDIGSFGCVLYEMVSGIKPKNVIRSK